VKSNIIWLLLAFLPDLALSASEKQDACEYFFQALKDIPHTALSRSEGEHTFLWDGKTKYSGCEIRFVTNNTLLFGRQVPAFYATPETDLFRLGWGMNHSMVADGPGSGIFGIEKGSVLCLISRSQPAYLDEKTNEIVQDDTLRLHIQCSQR
jgi:hypothetical protein